MEISYCPLILPNLNIRGVRGGLGNLADSKSYLLQYVAEH